MGKISPMVFPMVFKGGSYYKIGEGDWRETWKNY